MAQSPEHSKSPFDRRRFIGHGIKLTLLAGILSPLEQACNTKSKNPASNKGKDKSKSNTAKRTSTRKKATAEKLVINPRTNVAHLPTAAVYTYYDEIKKSNAININSWESQIQGQVRLNKDKSGTILEILSLQKLKNGLNDNSLNSAINTLARAFSTECANSKGVNNNVTNYRLHELMLQLVALNNYISSGGKWQFFNEKVQKPQRLGKRQQWMANESSFNDRVNYIRERENDYKQRLSQRASKYSLT